MKIYRGDNYRLECGDAVKFLESLPDNSVDAIITDPPYPEIDRDYGRLTEREWEDLMGGVLRESRRVLKPRGSAVYILQSNSESVGRVRPWLWKFMVKVCEEWNMVQDVWWWNYASPPTVHCSRKYGLMRPSLKAMVWAGDPSCYRNQEEILWGESEANLALRLGGRATNDLRVHPSGQSMRESRVVGVAGERGGRVTPFNVLPYPNSDSVNSAGSVGHGAGTPEWLCAWWVKYLTEPGRGSVVVDPFTGSGTVGVAALGLGRTFWGSEKEEKYVKTAKKRLDDADFYLREGDIPY